MSFFFNLFQLTNKISFAPGDQQISFCWFSYKENIVDFLFYFVKVPGVGKNNGLQLVMNPEPNGVPVKYRIFISEIGTTYSKVK